MMRQRIIAVTIAFFLLISLVTRSFAVAQSSSPVAMGRGGAVASVDRHATEIGIEVLRRGGNAIDAAVATAAALGVVEPFSAGIGGGGFMVIYQKADDQVITLDGREQAPASARVEMFNDPNTGELLLLSPNRISSGLAVGVPGTLLTWTEALNRYGTLSLAQALAPAIALAEKGFSVDATFARQVQDNQARFAAFSSTRDLYLPGGAPPTVGSISKNPDLAKTYRLVAESPNKFYRGEIGRAIVQTVQHPPIVENPPFAVLPGAMTTADLNDYDLHVRTPVAIDYRGYQLYGIGLPSSGSITGGQALKLLEGFDLASLDRPQALNKLIEAERIAFADRAAFLGDPEFVDAPVAGLLSRKYADLRRSEVGDRAMAGGRDARATAGNPLPFQSDPSPSFAALTTAQISDHEGLSTTHLTTADRFGNVVSYTLTIEATGGSGIVVPGYGFILNNELTDFDPTSPHPNAPEPQKRPRSSMAPTIAFAPEDGTVIAFGSPGGSTIITTVLGIATHLIDFKLPIDQAIAAPRISQRNGGVTQVDSGFESTELGQALTALGHVLDPVPEIGAATGIVIRPDLTMTAAAEPTRRGGGSAMTVRP
jgi:gamma-glutamyltranspeptidase / glutathione hydrolase